MPTYMQKMDSGKRWAREEDVDVDVDVDEDAALDAVADAVLASVGRDSEDEGFY